MGEAARNLDDTVMTKLPRNMVLLDRADYEKLVDDLDRAETYAILKQVEEDMEKGMKKYSIAEVISQLEKKYGFKRVQS